MSSQAYLFNPRNDILAAAGNGFGIPPLTTTQRVALSLDASNAGLMVFDSTLGTLFTWSGSAWQPYARSGTWDASFVDDGGGASFTLTSPTGSWELTGSQVHVSGRWNVSGVEGVGTGSLLISGLPFPVRTGDAYASAAAVWAKGFAAGAVTQIMGVVDSSTDTSIVVSYYQNGVLNPLAPHVRVNSQIAVNLTYRIA